MFTGGIDFARIPMVIQPIDYDAPTFLFNVAMNFGVKISFFGENMEYGEAKVPYFCKRKNLINGKQIA